MLDEAGTRESEAMSTELRRSGIDIIGDVSWGTHFCQFYRTAQDLLDILVPYFVAGLQNNEFCMWITSEPLGRGAAEKALAEALPDLERYVRKGQIEILPYTDWYLREGTFDSARVLADWVRKLETARAKGFDGLRLTGNTFWLEKKDWKAFTDYEAAVDGVIGRYRMLAVCTYSLDRCGANEVLDVVRNHRFALVRRESKWELIESTVNKQADAAIRRLAQFPRENPNPVLRVDETGSLLFANNPARDCLSALGATAAEPVPAALRSLAVKALAGGLAVQEEIRDARDRTYWFTAVRPPRESYVNIYAYDITKRKRTEQTLKESEEKYRRLFENMAEGFALHEIVTDASGRPCDYRFLDVNPAFERLTGLRQAEVAGRLVTDVLKGIEPFWVETYGKVALTGEPVTFERFYPAPLDRWFEIFAYRPGPRRFAVVFMDITVRKLAEQSLREIERRHEKSQEIAHLGSWELDIVRDRLIWSDEIYRIFGLRPQEFGATYEAFLAAVHPDDRAAVDTAYAESLRKNLDGYEIEHRVMRRDSGEVRFVHEKCEHLRDAGGRIVRSVGMIHDITERKRADDLRQALAEQERLRLGAAVEQASDAVVMVDLDGRIQYVNAAFETINRAQKADAMGRDYVDFVGCGPYADDIRGAVSQGKVWHGHLTRSRPGDRAIELEVTVSPAKDPAGALLGGLITERDVTAETILRQEVHRAQKMEALGTLAGGITHDFNNILGAIVINTELAMLELDIDSPARESLPLILKAANRGRDLVRQIVTFSRQRERDRKPVRIAPTIREGMALLRSTFPDSIEVHESIGAEEETVLADAAQLHQILSNLCQNASLAMCGGRGLIDVKLEPVQVDASLAARHSELKPGSYVRLTVADSGCGMSRETLERVFEPFFTTRSLGEGSGLGLSVVHGIVRGYGGAITAYSEVGKGSTFSVYLPCHLQEVPPPEAPEPQEVKTGSERILLVDDDAAQLKGLARTLELFGYRVTARSSGRTAATAFKKDPAAFDLIITDQTMPRMSGIELARSLVKVRPDIPVILCTGFSEKVNGENVGRDGVRAFIMKPFTAQEISGLIRKVLEKRSEDRPGE